MARPPAAKLPDNVIEEMTSEEKQDTIERLMETLDDKERIAVVRQVFGDAIGRLELIYQLKNDHDEAEDDEVRHQA